MKSMKSAEVGEQLKARGRIKFQVDVVLFKVESAWWVTTIHYPWLSTKIRLCHQVDRPKYEVHTLCQFVRPEILRTKARAFRPGLHQAVV